MNLIEQCKRFLIIKQHPSLRSAALACNITPMGLSKQLKLLETHLGKPLFDRKNNKLVITDFGIQFAQQAQKMVNSEQRLTNWLHSQNKAPQGKLTILVKPEIADSDFYQIIADFVRISPDIEIILEVVHEPFMAQDKQFDLLLGFPEYIGRHQQELIQKHLFNSDVALVASPAYLKKYGTPDHANQLHQHLFIGDRIMQPDYKVFIKEGEQFTKEQSAFLQPIESAIKTNDVLMAANFAEQGLGIAQAPVMVKQVQQAVVEGKLIAILGQYIYQDWPIYLYFEKHNKHNMALQSFMQFVEPAFKEVMKKRFNEMQALLGGF